MNDINPYPEATAAALVARRRPPLGVVGYVVVGLSALQVAVSALYAPTEWAMVSDGELSGPYLLFAALSGGLLAVGGIFMAFQKRVSMYLLAIATLFAIPALLQWPVVASIGRATVALFGCIFCAWQFRSRIDRVLKS